MRVYKAEGAIIRRQGPVFRSALNPLCLCKVNPLGEQALAMPLDTEKGHLLGLSIGGPDSAYNLVPMTRSLNQGDWATMEAAIHRDTSIKRMCVTLTYADDTAYCPESIKVVVFKRDQWEEWPGSPFPMPMVELENIVQRRLPARTEARLLAILQEAKNQLEDKDWKLEEQEGGTRFKGCLPGEQEPRKYAVLDYLLLAKEDEYDELQNALAPNTSNFAISKQNNFAAGQLAMIRGVNRLWNEGWLRSDESGERLSDNGTHTGPHVDHMVAKANNGPNAFSNARVISARENMSKGRGNT
ncbi:DNA/RNA non-specific endonuclease [Melittangium boletus]|nr:DNA/RNA non-specific endonuclease [Melittangium boletus]